LAESDRLNKFFTPERKAEDKKRFYKYLAFMDLKEKGGLKRRNILADMLKKENQNERLQHIR